MVEGNYHFEKYLLDNRKVIKLLDQAIKQNRGFSLARFGIGEMSYLSYPANELLVQEFKRYESYAGVSHAPEIIRRELVRSLRDTDIAGLIAPWRLDPWAKQTRTVLEELKFMPTKACCAWIMQSLLDEGTLWPWLSNKKVFLVGRRSKEAEIVFREQGIQISGSMGLDGYDELIRVQNELQSNQEWEIALISAGIPATILAPRIAKSTKKVAIDFGHALDMILDGEEYKLSDLVKKWNDQFKGENKN
ncbi:GT-D fold domain-containing glycosyltransferase [Peribacillus frigoritolerans]|uniref:GT-D fold domain-containing protein n=1 Tax=Peribacillus frigoritolerans TaxID=450367 RepID=UPI002B246B79|nr:GT-D fold domain-containing glycosyltransferase [Peribacillus frigoritolerans]MEB2628193.1 GT-D fold domain-containing glycosyltransferase [Peribacillus frigoritolerans]